MISTIQPAGMVLIVKIIFMLITGTCFVNGQYFSVAGFRLPCFALQAGCEVRDSGCAVQVLRLWILDFGFRIDMNYRSCAGRWMLDVCPPPEGSILVTCYLLPVTCHLSLVFVRLPIYSS